MATGLLIFKVSLSARLGDSTPVAETSLVRRKGAFTSARKSGFVFAAFPWSLKFCSEKVKLRLVVAVIRRLKLRSPLKRMLYLDRSVFFVSPSFFKKPSDIAYLAMLSPPVTLR